MAGGQRKEVPVLHDGHHLATSCGLIEGWIPACCKAIGGEGEFIEFRQGNSA